MMPYLYRKYCRPAVVFLAALIGSSLSCADENTDLQFHGFLSQGYLLSDGNNFYGNSLRGSTDYTEAGINSTWRASPTLNFAGQIISRDAGNTDNGDVKVDFLFADIKTFESDASGLGFRLGRVRNAFGLYNDTRDVLFTRPTILMPQAVYFEGNGFRELFFASDGVQLYSYWDSDENSTNFSFTLGRDKSLSADILRNLFGPSASLVHKAEFKTPIFMQLLHSRNGGDSKFAFSMLNVHLDLHSNSSFFSDITLDASGYVFSAQKNLATWTFTAEYSLLSTEFRTSLGNEVNEIESAYLQAQYRVRPDFTLTSRYEYIVLDRDNRSETDGHHLVFGARWTPSPSWIVDIDVYGIRGQSGIPGVDNADNMPLSERTEIFSVMIGYRF
ncbi:hypothetical protein [uncultured Zhongshania sp.]|uniref:hypothetical protein n=1 Tax=uncultured Zhongshania sp. TaxID=1642288 RepID=UPI0030D9FE83|tara:strand:- start:6352 stop:7512 length:1161 start_codon:yes stop_codon:yes gene_type:complete